MSECGLAFCCFNINSDISLVQQRTIPNNIVSKQPSARPRLMTGVWDAS